MSNNNSESIDIQVLHTILINLVTVPDDVKITRYLDEQGVLLSVAVNAQDMGIVIGRNGGMAMAIKSIMKAVGKANKMNIRVQFLEPDGSVRYSDEYRKPTGGPRGEGNRDQQPRFERNQDSFSGNPEKDNLMGDEPTKQAPINNNHNSISSHLDDDLGDFVIN